MADTTLHLYGIKAWNTGQSAGIPNTYRHLGQNKAVFRRLFLCRSNPIKPVAHGWVLGKKTPSNQPAK